MESDGDQPGAGDDVAGDAAWDRSLASGRGESPNSRQNEGDFDSSGSEYRLEDDNEHPRFPGFDSTYRSYIRNEASLLESLSKQDGADLGAHLYNAHTWKRRHYAPQSEQLSSTQSKTSWLQRDETGATPWCPTPDWTAWPLPPEQLNGKGASFGSIYPSQSESGPVSELREEIQGLMLRRAKEQSRLRTWSRRSSSLTPEVVDRPVKRTVETDDDSEGLASADSPTAESRSTSARREEVPSITDDDEHAADLLKPITRHITSNLDDLLHGLHQNRAGHRLMGPYSRPSSSGSSSVSAADHKPGSSNRSMSAHRPTQPGPRDWSEVLGVAALVGWDPAIVQRARRRCSEMFGEDTSFHTVPEPLSLAPEPLYDHKLEEIPQSAHASEEEEHSNVEMKDLRDASAAPRNSRHFCPYPDCGRSGVPYQKAWRWRAHLKRKHHLTGERVRELEDSVGDQVADDGDSGQDEEGFICPYEDCSRHKQPFVARWRLHEHLKRTHQHTIQDARKLTEDTVD